MSCCFPRATGKCRLEAQQTIAKIVPILAPKQQAKIQVNGYTDNVPIGPGLMRQGITSNLELSQKRADERDAVHDRAGSQLPPSVGAGFRRGRKTQWPRTTRRQGQAQNRRVELTLAGSGN